MTKTFYSTTTFLTLSINRHLYDGKHYVYVAEGFYPYGTGNPKSSNPLLIYTDLYQPWRDKDEHDKFVLQHRLAVRKGVIAKEKDKVILSQIAKDLRKVADLVILEFFYPVVYRVNLDISALLGSGRVTVAGSGLHGSNEFLILDLDEKEYETLFNDNYTYHFTDLRESLGFFSSKVDAVNELLRWSP